MLARLLAPHVTGSYTFTAVPLSLPTPLVSALLPSATPLLLPSPSRSQPPTPDGESWVVLELGKQSGTGVGGVLGGKSDFMEAKLEIPFLALPGSSTPVTLKHTLLFSSVMMAVSGRFVTGLRAHRGVFLQGETHTEGVEGWMEVREEQAAGEEEERGWSEDALREVLTGWWVGEKSGGTATRFHFTSVQPPRRRPSLKVRLHLPSLLGQSLDATLELIKEIDDHSGKKKLAVDEQGWLELRASGWSLSEATSMEARTVSSL